MFTISKSFDFEASHRLEGLPENHKCGNTHGHSYNVTVTLSSYTLNEHGFIMDFGELDRLKHWLNEEFDHKHLNDVVPFQTSSERLAKHIYLKARIMYGDIVDAVAVSETDKTMAVYYE